MLVQVVLKCLKKGERGRGEGTRGGGREEGGKARANVRRILTEREFGRTVHGSSPSSYSFALRGQ